MAAVAALAGCAGIATAGDGLPPMGCTAQVRVDGQLVFSGDLVPKVIPGSLSVGYGLDVGGGAVGWVVQVGLRVTHDTSENGELDGFVNIRNLGFASRDFAITVQADGCPLIIDECETGGEVSIRVFFDEDGGLVYVPYGRSGYQARIDEAPVATIFGGPWFIQGTGQGIAGTTDEYGQPQPSLPVVSMTRGFGFATDLRISGGELVVLEIDSVTGGPASAFEPCSPPAAAAPAEPIDAEDLRRRITAVLTGWALGGQPGSEPGGLAGDEDGDGTVGPADLQAILFP